MRKAALIIISTAYLCLGAESKILSTIGNFMPNVTEIGYLTSMVNVYIQVSQFVRSTNKIVNNIKQAKEQWAALTDQISYMYESVKALRNVNPLDLQSCQRAVQSSQLLLTGELSDAARLFTNLEAYTIDQPIEFMQNIETEQMYKDFKDRTGVQVDRFYLNDQYKQALDAFDGALDTQTRTKIMDVEAAQLTLLDGRDYSQLSVVEKKQYDALEHRRIGLQTLMLEQPYASRNKLDSIIDEARNLMAVNLTEINVTERRIQSMDELHATLMDQYNKLVDANAATYKNDNAQGVNTIDESDPQYGSTANQVPFPKAPENAVPTQTSKKEPNQQDVVSLQNQIKYVLFKQECLYRDLAAMKVNTMAFVLSYEALSQYRTENQSIFNCVSYTKMAAH